MNAHVYINLYVCVGEKCVNMCICLHWCIHCKCMVCGRLRLGMCAHGRVCGTEIPVNIISVILASCIESAAKGPANICFEIFEADAAEQGSRGTSGQLRIFNFRPHVSRLLLSGYVME